jgi:probable rRNA maturation factor
MAIVFNNEYKGFKLKQPLALKRWIKDIVALQKKTPGDIHFVFTGDEDLLQINLRYLQHDTYTDIITFDYSEQNVISGDIMISVERVEENAKKLKVDFEEELRRVMIHGILHLCGYKDKSRADAAEMRLNENWALKKLKA